MRLARTAPLIPASCRVAVALPGHFRRNAFIGTHDETLCELVSGMCEPSPMSLGQKMEKAIPRGETGRVIGRLSAARARSQGSHRRGKSLKYPPLCTCE